MKIWENFLWLDSSRVFFGYPKQSKIHGSAPGVVPIYPSRIELSVNDVQSFHEIFTAQRFSMGFFGV